MADQRRKRRIVVEPWSEYLQRPNLPVTRGELAYYLERSIKAADRVVKDEIGRRTILGVLGRVIAWVQVAVLGYFGPRRKEAQGADA